MISQKKHDSAGFFEKKLVRRNCIAAAAATEKRPRTLRFQSRARDQRYCGCRSERTLHVKHTRTPSSSVTTDTDQPAHTGRHLEHTHTHTHTHTPRKIRNITLIPASFFGAN
jgi:hypothetical protein